MWTITLGENPKKTADEKNKPGQSTNKDSLAFPVCMRSIGLYSRYPVLCREPHTARRGVLNQLNLSTLLLKTALCSSPPS